MKRLLAACLLVLFVFGIARAQKKPPVTPIDKEGLYTTTKELKEKYQKVNASILAVLIDPRYYNGPHAGPGLITGHDGPLLMIEWLGGKETDEKASRKIAIGSIVSIDRPIDRKEKMDLYVVYYKGPWGETEFALLPNTEGMPEKIIQRWKSYLLSQEPVK